MSVRPYPGLRNKTYPYLGNTGQTLPIWAPRGSLKEVALVLLTPLVA